MKVTWLKVDRKAESIAAGLDVSPKRVAELADTAIEQSKTRGTLNVVKSMEWVWNYSQDYTFAEKVGATYLIGIKSERDYVQAT